jgi:endo-1,4-beta-D-glucanase Y
MSEGVQAGPPPSATTDAPGTATGQAPSASGSSTGNPAPTIGAGGVSSQPTPSEPSVAPPPLGVGGAGGTEQQVPVGGGGSGGDGGESSGGVGASPPGPDSPLPDAPPYFPFPSQRGPGPYCQLPSNADSAEARVTYQSWKDTLVTADGANGFRRVRRPDTPDGEVNSTVSEGIAYGMILAALYDDQPLFDDLYRYSVYWARDNGLMDWYINAAGTQSCPGESSCGAATDSDEDIAFALILADRQWGGQGQLDDSYQNHARAQIERVAQHEVAPSGIVKPGDQWGGDDTLNLSYFAPAFYELFAAAGDAEFWQHVIDVNYGALEASLNAANGNQSNGLVPAWSNAAGEPVVAFDGAPTHYQYDSARMPCRVAMHYCWFGDERAKSYLDKVNSFFVPIGADKITDGYELDGTPRAEAAPEASSQSAVFVGCAALGAMADVAHEPFVAQAYDLLKTGTLTVRSTYYQLSWTAMSMAFMTGNFFDFTEYR